MNMLSIAILLTVFLIITITIIGKAISYIEKTEKIIKEGRNILWRMNTIQ